MFICCHSSCRRATNIRSGLFLHRRKATPSTNPKPLAINPKPKTPNALLPCAWDTLNPFSHSLGPRSSNPAHPTPQASSSRNFPKRQLFKPKAPRFTTKSGRDVHLEIFAAKEDKDQLWHAMRLQTLGKGFFNKVSMWDKNKFSLLLNQEP